MLPNPLKTFPFLKHLGIYGYRRGTLFAAGEVLGVAAGKRGEAGTVARIGKWHPDRRREGGLR